MCAEIVHDMCVRVVLVCARVLGTWQDLSGARTVIADANSHAHGDPSTKEPIDDDVRRFMESLQGDAQHHKTRPWEGR